MSWHEFFVSFGVLALSALFSALQSSVCSSACGKSVELMLPPLFLLPPRAIGVALFCISLRIQDLIVCVCVEGGREEHCLFNTQKENFFSSAFFEAELFLRRVVLSLVY